MAHPTFAASENELSRARAAKAAPTEDEYLVARLRYLDALELVRAADQGRLGNTPDEKLKRRGEVLETAGVKKFLFDSVCADFDRSERAKEVASSHALGVSNEKIAKRQLWIAASIGLFTLVQAAGVALDHLQPSPKTVVCSGGK